MSQTGTDSSGVLSSLAVFGVDDVGDLGSVRPFRISTMQEVTLSRAILIRSAGLRFSDFAENPWGFPFIPYPQDRNAQQDGRLILAPSTVAMGWVGHPIFWIDPALTAPLKSEERDTARWCVRMFYLIMAMGLWDTETLAWHDAIKSRGVEYTEADWKNYTRGFSSALDDVRYGVGDLLIPYEEVLRSTEIALQQCASIQEAEWERYRTEQAVAYRDATKYLQPYGGEAEEIDQALGSLSETVARRVMSNEAISDLVTPTFDYVRRLSALLTSMDRVSLILNSTVARSQTHDQISFARVATALSTYHRMVADGGYERELSESVQRLFSLEAVTPAEDFARLHSDATNLHLEAYRRLKVATVNFIRVERGEQPYANYSEMQMMDQLGDESITDFPDLEEVVGDDPTVGRGDLG